MRLLPVAVLFVVSTASCRAVAPLPRSTCSRGEATFSRVAVVGASFSAGFGWRRQEAGGATLAQLLEATLEPRETPARSLASPWFFSNPRVIGEGQVRAALAYEPTLVVALDFLFWFAHAPGLDDAGRLERLRQGLALLERIPATLVVADLPDMSGAVGKALTPDMLPSSSSREALNRHIAEWAARRRDVMVVPLGAWLAQEPASRVLQADGLHPTREGAELVVARVMGMLLNACPEMGPAAGGVSRSR